jgi:hypothetical protein
VHISRIAVSTWRSISKHAISYRELGSNGYTTTHTLMIVQPLLQQHLCRPVCVFMTVLCHSLVSRALATDRERSEREGPKLLDGHDHMAVKLQLAFVAMMLHSTVSKQHARVVQTDAMAVSSHLPPLAWLEDFDSACIATCFCRLRT